MALEGKTTFKLNDYDGESGTFSVRSNILTALNFDSEQTDLTAMEATIGGMTHGLMTEVIQKNQNLLAIGKEDSVLAQRELKWLVQYHSLTTFKAYTVSIPTADPSLLDPQDRGNAHIGDGGIVDAFVTAFEAYVLAPTGGPVEIDEITLVGRNV